MPTIERAGFFSPQVVAAGAAEVRTNAAAESGAPPTLPSELDILDGPLKADLTDLIGPGGHAAQRLDFENDNGPTGPARRTGGGGGRVRLPVLSPNDATGIFGDKNTILGTKWLGGIQGKAELEMDESALAADMNALSYLLFRGEVVGKEGRVESVPMVADPKEAAAMLLGQIKQESRGWALTERENRKAKTGETWVGRGYLQLTQFVTKDGMYDQFWEWLEKARDTLNPWLRGAGYSTTIPAKLPEREARLDALTHAPYRMLSAYYYLATKRLVSTTISNDADKTRNMYFVDPELRFSYDGRIYVAQTVLQQAFNALGKKLPTGAEVLAMNGLNEVQKYVLLSALIHGKLNTGTHLDQRFTHLVRAKEKLATASSTTHIAAAAAGSTQAATGTSHGSTANTQWTQGTSAGFQTATTEVETRLFNGRGSPLKTVEGLFVHWDQQNSGKFVDARGRQVYWGRYPLNRENLSDFLLANRERGAVLSVARPDPQQTYQAQAVAIPAPILQHTCPANVIWVDTGNRPFDLGGALQGYELRPVQYRQGSRLQYFGVLYAEGSAWPAPQDERLLNALQSTFASGTKMSGWTSRDFVLEPRRVSPTVVFSHTKQTEQACLSAQQSHLSNQTHQAVGHRIETIPIGVTYYIPTSEASSDTRPEASMWGSRQNRDGSYTKWMVNSSGDVYFRVLCDRRGVPTRFVEGIRYPGYQPLR